MIDNKELRKGNKILVGPMVQTVKAIYDDDAIRTELYYVHDSTDDKAPNVAKPIPLTEEWLLRMGFKEVKMVDGIWAYCYQGFYYVNDGQIRFMCEKDGVIFLDQNVLIYIHQLQNLYFALTGEELKIKDQ